MEVLPWLQPWKYLHGTTMHSLGCTMVVPLLVQKSLYSLQYIRVWTQNLPKTHSWHPVNQSHIIQIQFNYRNQLLIQKGNKINWSKSVWEFSHVGLITWWRYHKCTLVMVRLRNWNSFKSSIIMINFYFISGWIILADHWTVSNQEDHHYF